jgi:hypothetical protein
MAAALDRIPLRFWRSTAGREPVREMVDRIADRRPPHHWPRYSEDAIWLADWSSIVPSTERQTLWEIRTSLPSKREARVLFGFHDNELIALHAFIKKTPRTPPAELALARQRLKEIAS